MLVNLIQDIHKSTKRDYMGRMLNNKVECSEVARKFDKDFWDGDRKYGYGGYKDDGRWIPLAQKLIKRYGLYELTNVLDIGCGKGYLAKAIEDLSGAKVSGVDISKYALKQNPLEDKAYCEIGKHKLRDAYDLIISINTLHNLILPNLVHAIKEINSHCWNSYIVVESYRNTQELFNLQCWALTCEQFLRPEEWEFLFKEYGYKGDYEFIFFE